MKRRTWIGMGLVCAAVVAAGGYLFLTKFDIYHETLALHDAARNRDVPVELSLSRRALIKARLGLGKPPVALVNHGYTVKNNEYTFLANVLASEGYMVASIQHDLPGDAPLSQSGFPFVGRMPMYERGVANIEFALAEIQKRYPKLDYSKLTMLGHSNGGDISMFYAGHNPEKIERIVTLDNLRVPFLMQGKMPILSFRSRDWKPDSGVVPSDEICAEHGIQLVHTDAQHTEMSDRGPEKVKEAIKTALTKFLKDVKQTPAPAPAPKSLDKTLEQSRGDQSSAIEPAPQQMVRKSGEPASTAQ